MPLKIRGCLFGGLRVFVSFRGLCFRDAQRLSQDEKFPQYGEFCILQNKLKNTAISYNDLLFQIFQKLFNQRKKKKRKWICGRVAMTMETCELSPWNIKHFFVALVLYIRNHFGRLGELKLTMETQARQHFWFTKFWETFCNVLYLFLWFLSWKWCISHSVAKLDRCE